MNREGGAWDIGELARDENRSAGHSSAVYMANPGKPWSFLRAGDPMQRAMAELVRERMP